MVTLPQARLLALLILLLLAAACAPGPAVPPAADPLQPVQPTTHNTEPPEPSARPGPTATGLPEPEVLLFEDALSPETAGRVGLLAELGKGALFGAPIFSPAGRQLAIPTAAGTYIFDAGLLTEQHRLPVSTPFLAFSPDGSLLAAGGRLKVTLWDTATGGPAGSLTASPEDTFWDISFSPDGSLLAAVSADREVSIWSLPARERLFVYRGDSLSFSPDSSMAAVTVFGEDLSVVYAMDSGAEVTRYAVHRAGFTPGGQLWLEDQDTVRIAYLERKLVSAPFLGTRPAFSADGTQMALLTGRQVTLFDHASGRRVLALEGRYAGAEGLVFSPDGTTLTGDMTIPLCPTCTAQIETERSLVVWRVSDGSVIAKLPALVRTGKPAYSPDGSRLAVAAAESILLYHSADGSPAGDIGAFFAPVIGLARSPDGRILATAHATDPYTLRFWDLDSGEPVQKLVGLASASAEEHLDLAFNRAGDILAAGGDLWDVSTGRQLTVYSQAIIEMTSCWSSAVAFAPQADVLATGCFDGQLDLWQMPGGGLLRRLDGFSGWVDDTAFSPDGELIAAVYGVPDDRVQVWNAAAGEPAFALTGARYTRAAFSPDGRLLAAGELDPANEMYGWRAGPVGLWDAGTGSPFGRLDGPGAVSFAFSPDGRLLAAGTLAGPVQLWDLVGGAITDLNGHFAAVQEVLFEPAGTRLISASLDGTVRLWGLPPVEAGADWPVYAKAACGFSLAYPPGWRVLETPAGVYETAGPEVWLTAGELPMPQTGSRADLTLRLLDRDPLPDWSPEKFDGYEREDLNPGGLAAVRVTGLNRESGFVETAVIVELPACWLLALPNGSPASEAFFEPIVRSLR